MTEEQTNSIALKALVIDDDPEIRREIVDILDEYVHGYDEAGNIKEARNKMLTCRFDYVLLDMELPYSYGKPLLRENGDEFLKELRAQYPTESLPIIVVTGTVPESNKAASLLYDGATAFVSKPISTGHPTLREAIQKYIIWRNARVSYQAETQPPQEVWEAENSYAADSTLHGWLQMQRHGYKTITWRTWNAAGNLHKVRDMSTSRIACKILKLLHQALPGNSLVEHGKLVEAGSWNESEYYSTSKRGKLVAYDGIARNRLCEIKKELGIDYKFEPGGVRFFQPQ